MRQTKSIIILKNRQEISETESFICKNIINSDSNSLITNRLINFQAITLFPQKVFTVEIDENQFLLILPLIGGLEILNNDENSTFIENESLEFISKIGTINFYNPFEKDAVQFILIKIENKTNSFQKSENYKFDLNQINQLTSIFDNNLLNIKLSIGQFSARNEAEYGLSLETNSIFSYNISGVFEVDNKLLELNDALIMTDLPDFEFESLTNNSILLVLEC